MATVTEKVSQEEKGNAHREAGQTERGGRLLRAALTGNALFSAVSGVTLVALAGRLPGWTGIGSAALFAAVGAGLLPWAYVLFSGARGKGPLALKSLGRLAIAGDLIWVLGSIILLVARPVTLTTAGVWGVALVADVVALFAFLQFVGLRRIRAR